MQLTLRIDADAVATSLGARYTFTKTSPQNIQNITSHKFKSLAIIPSPSRRTMWANYPKTKFVRAVSE